jgi:glutathione S-transferase
MNLTLYWGSGSPVSWRALLALELKQLSYQSHQLALSDKEHRSAEFLALSPRGTFPILRDGDRVVRESLAILNYLESIQKEPPLLGSSPEEVAEIWRHIGEHESYLGSAVQTITRAFFRKAGVTDEEALKKALETTAAELDGLNRRLQESKWIAGERVSAADIVYYPTVHRLLRAAGKAIAQEHGLSKDPLAVYPAVRAWLAHMADLPGVDATYPPHWRSNPV